VSKSNSRKTLALVCARQAAEIDSLFEARERHYKMMTEMKDEINGLKASLECADQDRLTPAEAYARTLRAGY
jgi:hypothetical protein